MSCKLFYLHLKTHCFCFSFNPIIRYGEHNPCFSVATFSNDNEEDKDVAKKVTSALERVTSDYHSGSSSDEESIRTSPLTVLNSRSPYQVRQYTIYLNVLFRELLTETWAAMVCLAVDGSWCFLCFPCKGDESSCSYVAS